MPSWASRFTSPDPPFRMSPRTSMSAVLLTLKSFCPSSTSANEIPAPINDVAPLNFKAVCQSCLPTVSRTSTSSAVVSATTVSSFSRAAAFHCTVSLPASRSSDTESPLTEPKVFETVTESSLAPVRILMPPVTMAAGTRISPVPSPVASLMLVVNA